MPIVYSGSIERIDFGERKEDKGFCHVCIEGSRTNVTFIKTMTRAFIQIDVALTDEINQTNTIMQKILEQPIKDSIIKITYTLDRSLKDRVDRIALEQACVQACFLVGIFPVYTGEQRRMRSRDIDQALSPLESINYYLKQNIPDQHQSLMTKAQALFDELSTEQNI